ncbi:hypothetical protein V501_06455 [Pseudogymnoascus sp. VKM F-4519 (FW-2642)]|nr:hypothetical protein V501_06455 [Pseudogymnoascus sp. VKM F-4519 (FW-2642)]
MTRRSIDHRGLRDELPVVDQNRPHVDEDEQAHIRDLLEREDEGEHMVRNRLREPVEWVKRMRRERRGHNPLMMGFMQRLIDRRVMQSAMNKVDEEIRKEEESRELEEIVPRPRSLGRGVVELGVAAALGDEAGGGQQGHDGHGGVGLGHFEADLVFEEFGVREGRVVEEEVVGGCGNDEVEG